MASLKDIRRRIGAVKGTQKVTRAMKLVAAAKLRRAQQTAIDSRAYATELYDMAMRVSQRLGPNAPFLWRRPQAIDCVDIVVVTSDRGLCGGFNENLLRRLEGGIATTEDHSIAVKLFVIGKKGVRHCRARKLDMEVVPVEDGDEAAATWIIDRILQRYKNGDSAGANILFNRFSGAASYEPLFWNLVPLFRRGSDRDRYMEYLYEPLREDVLDGLAMATLRATLLQIMMESRGAELAARMAAMDSATRNADDMIAHLTFVYNRARQETITRELIDIVGGAEALK